MMEGKSEITPASIALASGAIITSLLEHLMEKGALSKEEIRAILGEAHKGVALHSADPNTTGFASEFIAYLMRERFPIR